MANDETWCRFGSGVAKHKKTQALAERLGLPVYAAGGLLAFLWSWSIDHAEGENGSINDFSIRAIEKACEWDGKRGVLVKALCACGFLDGEPDSEHDPLRIHDWVTYNGAILEHRRKEAEKKRKRRETERLKRMGTVPLGNMPVGLSPGTVPGDVSMGTVPLPTVTVTENRNSKQITEDSREEDTSMELSGEVSDSPLFSLPLNDGSFHGITQADIDSYSKLYPAVDIPQEIRKMIGWLDSNPQRRKTHKGIKNFINSWLSKEQDKGGTSCTQYKPNSRTTGTYASEEDFY